MDIDLNIDNYSISNIKSLLNITNEKYDESIIDYKIQEIKNQIFESCDITNEFKDSFNIFLKCAKSMLIPIHINNNDNLGNNLKYDVNISHPVQQELVVPVKNIYDYKYPKGLLNPVERRVITKSLCIDSLFRENYNTTLSTNFHYNLPQPINNVINMKISSIEIPNFWYDFSSKKQNNFFKIVLFNMNLNNDVSNTVDKEFTIVIPDGNYNTDTMTTTINNYFINIGGGLDFLFFEINESNSNTIIRARKITDPDPTLSLPSPYNPLDPKYSPLFYFTIKFNDNLHTPLYKTMGWMLGFKLKEYTVHYEDAYKDDTKSFTGSIIYYGYLRSESSYGTSVYNYIFVDIDDYQKNFTTDSIISYNNNSYLGNNILARITVNTGYNSLLIDNASDRIFKQRDYFGPIKLEKLNIKLLDKYGEILDLNYNDFSIVLELQILY